MKWVVRPHIIASGLIHNLSTVGNPRTSRGLSFEFTNVIPLLEPRTDFYRPRVDYFQLFPFSFEWR